RSPFRFTLDPVSGRPILGDVGWNTWEEVNLVNAGSDYGWPCWEGNTRTPGYSDLNECTGRSTVSPLWTYNHDGAGASITGGVVYTGSSYPAEYRGRYFYGDYAQKRLYSLKFDNTGTLVTPPETGGLGTGIGAPV